MCVCERSPREHDPRFSVVAVLCDRVRNDNADEDDAPCNGHPAEYFSLLPGATLTCAKGCFSLQIVQCTRYVFGELHLQIMRQQRRKLRGAI